MLAAAYDREPSSRRQVRSGECLATAGQPQRCLFRLRRGVVTGRFGAVPEAEPEGLVYRPGDWLGLTGFFSACGTADLTLVAREPCEVFCLTRTQAAIPVAGLATLAEQFLPLVVLAAQRQQDAALQVAANRPGPTQSLHRLATLGQLAAGAAHELNNALTALTLGTRFLSEALQAEANRAGGLPALAYDSGLAGGRALDSASLAAQAETLVRQFGLDMATARRLAGLGIAPAVLAAATPAMLARADEICARWELGATLYDMEIAGDQAEHIVAAMRSLGNRRADRAPGLAVNDSLRAALALTRPSHKRLSLSLDLDAGAGTLHGHLGELVQIWTNLIRNACEALGAAKPPQPVLTVRSAREDDFIRVTVADNGPGIPAEILPLLFQPHVSSRQGGSHNLGLGLSIVKQLVDSYGGSIEVQTAPGHTDFTVRLPIQPRA